MLEPMASQILNLYRAEPPFANLTAQQAYPGDYHRCKDKPCKVYEAYTLRSAWKNIPLLKRTIMFNNVHKQNGGLEGPLFTNFETFMQTGELDGNYLIELLQAVHELGWMQHVMDFLKAFKELWCDNPNFLRKDRFSAFCARFEQLLREFEAIFARSPLRKDNLNFPLINTEYVNHFAREQLDDGSDHEIDRMRLAVQHPAAGDGGAPGMANEMRVNAAKRMRGSIVIDLLDEDTEQQPRKVPRGLAVQHAALSDDDAPLITKVTRVDDPVAFIDLEDEDTDQQGAPSGLAVQHQGGAAASHRGP
jgi:hypothetical protein